MTVPVRPPQRQLDVGDRLLRALQRVLARLSADRIRLVKYLFMAQAISPQPLGIVARAGGVTIQEVTRGDPRLAAFPRPPAEIERRFAAGARCLAAWHDESFAGFLWFTEGQYDEDEVNCTFRLHARDRAVWDFDVFVDPRFRAGRTFALLWDSALRAMHASGKLWSISRVSAFNIDSIRAHQRLGAQRTGWALFCLVGSLQFTLTSLGQLTCRRLEHGPYPTLEVRAPAADGIGLSEAPPEAQPARRAVRGD